LSLYRSLLSLFRITAARVAASGLLPCCLCFSNDIGTSIFVSILVRLVVVVAPSVLTSRLASLLHFALFVPAVTSAFLLFVRQYIMVAQTGLLLAASFVGIISALHLLTQSL